MESKKKLVRTVKAEPSDRTKDRVNIGVSIDAELWKKLRALAIMKDKNTGEVLDEAIADYIKQNKGVL